MKSGSRPKAVAIHCATGSRQHSGSVAYRRWLTVRFTEPASADNRAASQLCVVAKLRVRVQRQMISSTLMSAPAALTGRRFMPVTQGSSLSEIAVMHQQRIRTRLTAASTRPDWRHALTNLRTAHGFDCKPFGQ